MMYGYGLFIVAVFLLNYSDAQDVETVEAVVGHTAELSCNVTAETENAKLTVLAWYRNGSSTAFYSGDLRGESSRVVGSERYRLVEAEDEGLQKLQILSVRPSDAGLYRCLADFSASRALNTYIKLSVIEPPQRLWVIYENGTRVTSASAGSNTSRNIGPYYVGDVLHLFCVAFGGKPQPTMSWSAEGNVLKQTCTPLSEQRVRSDLTYGPLRREDHGRVVTCFANNNDHTLPLSIGIVIEMYLPPELVAIRVSGERVDRAVARVVAGEPLSLQCRVLGARPLPPVLWRLDDTELDHLEQNVTREPSQRLLVSEVSLSVSAELDERRVTCCAPAHRREEQYMCAAALPLTVMYPPVVQIVVGENLVNDTLLVVKGSNVTFNCSYKANPDVHRITWFHEDEPIEDTDPENGDSSMEATRSLVGVSEEDAGDYVCCAANEQGITFSEPLVIDVTYPAYCEDESTIEYGVASSESINLTCNVKANPLPLSYRWVFVSETNASDQRANHTHTLDTDEPTFTYTRPADTTYTLIHCWGNNGVVSSELPSSGCSFAVTDETAPQPPADCRAVRQHDDITVTCTAGHGGGLPQKFKFSVQALDSKDEITLSINQEPTFIIPEPKTESYTLVIKAFNDKGDSKPVEIDMASIIDETQESAETISSVTNITTLALSLCGGVALLALAACGLVLCAHERSERPDLPLDRSDPPLCAYNTEESNCDTFHDSDDGSECNIRRTESFRRAMSKYPSKNYDVKRTSSFHSARYINDVDHDPGKSPRHRSTCRVHSLQNINRKRDMDVLCDHLVMHLPPETNYNVAKPMNTFYTMPRKMRHKAAKEISDETSEITQTSDGFSLPPPPDEFGTYRAASRIKDVPPKATPTYSTIIRKNSGKDPNKYSNVIISPMNTVGLPTISGHPSVYSYPDDDHHHQANTNPFDE